MGTNGSYKTNDDFVAAIRELRLVMRFLGIWQQPGLPGWYKLIWYVQTSCLFAHAFAPTAGLVVNRHDAAKTIGNLSILVPLLLTVVHWLAFAVHRGTIGQLIELMEEDWINLERDTLICQSVPDCKQIMTKYYRYAKMCFCVFFVTTMSGVCSFVRDSLVSLSLEKHGTDYERINLFVAPYSWYPLDYARGYTFEILFGFQVIASTVLTLVRASIDNFFVTVILNLCAQFEILRCFTESITYDSSDPGICTEKVKLMIKRHYELLRASEKLQESCSFITAGHYAAVTLAICFLGYELITEMEKADSSIVIVIKMGFFCIAFTQLMFFYCLVGDELTNQSIAVVGAIYNSEWYKCPRSVCLSFMLMMVRAHRPVEITGAKLITMSLKSFANLLKASMSYLSVLRAIGVSEG